jgi:hypothetical protein
MAGGFLSQRGYEGRMKIEGEEIVDRIELPIRVFYEML